MEWTEQQAVAQARGGDPEAFRALVERHSRSLFRLGYRMTGNEHDAEEVVQETLLRAYRRLGRFEQRANFGTWLYRIAVNCALDLRRAKKREESRREAPGPDPEAESSLDSIPAAGASPERLAISSEIRREVSLAMDRLTDAERAAFVLRHFEGHSIEEIGATLGLAASATKNTIFRAVQKLRGSLAPLASAAR